MVNALTMNNKFGAMLKNAPSVGERNRMLKELLLEFVGSDKDFNSLACGLERSYGIVFGVCRYFSVDDGKKFCHITSPKTECSCSPPQHYCAIRDWSRVPPKRK